MNYYAEGVKLYRRLIPGRLRARIGRLRSRGSVWTQARAESQPWFLHEYSQARWEREYSTDQWHYMHELPELSRYSVVVGYARHLCPDAAILDLGSGEGILQARLGTANYAQYVGVDLSRSAIERARSRQDTKTTFVCDDVARYVPDRCFDVIVWNEVLYYLADPVSVMRRYERYLSSRGIFIVSMFMTPETSRNWQTLQSAYDFIDETRAGNAQSGFSWSCRVARPGAR